METFMEEWVGLTRQDLQGGAGEKHSIWKGHYERSSPDSATSWQL